MDGEGLVAVLAFGALGSGFGFAELDDVLALLAMGAGDGDHASILA
jgi:hypothetical protein